MELFLCHVRIDGSISDTFPPFAKTNAFFSDSILVMYQKVHIHISLVSKQN